MNAHEAFKLERQLYNQMYHEAAGCLPRPLTPEQDSIALGAVTMRLAAAKDVRNNLADYVALYDTTAMLYLAVEDDILNASVKPTLPAI